MQKFSRFFLILIVFSFGLFAAENYKVDATKSSVIWEATKVTGSHHGTVQISEGVLVFENDNFTGGEFKINMTTIEVKDLDPGKSKDKLENHLRSDDFFSVEKNPFTMLKITGAEKAEGNRYNFTGEVTIKGITKPVAFLAEVILKDGSGSANAEIVLDRAQFDIQYRSGSFFEDLGDKLIYDEFKLKVALVFSK